MRVLQISADRSKRGILFAGTSAAQRQEAYARAIGELDVIGFSRRSDGASHREFGSLRMHPTNSRSRLFYIVDALRIARTQPKPDVVSAQDPFETGITALFIARRFGVPLHIQMHTDVFDSAYATSSFLNRIRAMLARVILRRADRIRVVSERIKKSLIAHLGIDEARIRVLPIFADVHALATIPADSALSVKFSTFAHKLLVVSRLEKEKNVALALHAFKESAPPGTCLIIVGDGSERSALAALARRLDVADRVFFEGEVSAAPYYKIVDLVLVTSAFEGYGLVIVEALASGTPVLSTDVGIAAEVGALIAPAAQFGPALARWFTTGGGHSQLRNYPYADFGAYVDAYRADIASACK